MRFLARCIPVLGLWLFCAALVPASAQPQVLSNTGEYKAVEGKWLILGRQTGDGGFSCSMTHVASNGAYTMFTALQPDLEDNHVYMHRSLFIPWTGRADGLTASLVLDAEQTEPVPIQVIQGMAVVPLNLIQLRGAVKAMQEGIALSVVFSTPNIPKFKTDFPIDGASAALLRQSECIRLLRPSTDSP